MKVGDLVKHKQYPHTIGIIVKSDKISSAYCDRTLTIHWTINPPYVDVGQPQVFVEKLCQLGVIHESR